MALVTEAHFNDCRRTVNDTFRVLLGYYIFFIYTQMFVFFYGTWSLSIECGVSSEKS